MTERRDELDRYHGGCAETCGIRWLLARLVERDGVIADLLRQVHLLTDQIEAARRRAA